MTSVRDQNWQDHQPDVQEALCYAYRHSLFSDVTIHTAKDKSSICFSAHKMVLAIRSPEFADLLFGKTRKSSIVSLDISPRALDIILWYIYSNTIEVEDIDELLESCRAARQFKVTGFSEICCSKLLELSSNLQESNVLLVMEEASLLNSTELFSKCLVLVENALERILRSDDFHSLSKDTLWKMLKAVKLSTCPETILRSVMKWMQKNGTTKDRLLLSVFDFAEFTVDGFLDVVEEFKDFFSKDELYSITTNLLQPGLCNLPQWCKFSKTKECCVKLHLPSPHEGVEAIKEKAIKIQTNCNQRFNKFSFLSPEGFQQDLLLKVTNPCRSLRHVMIELAFGTDYVPIENLKIELRCNVGPGGKMQSIRFYLISSREHYYMVPSGDETLLLEGKNSFNLLLNIEAEELTAWGPGGPVSNLKYRTVLVSNTESISLDVTGNRQILPPVTLKTFEKFLLFVDPESCEKKFAISALYFDTIENTQNYLAHVEKCKRLN